MSWASAALLALAATPPLAQDAPDRWQPAFAVLGNVGFGTPTGFLGVSAEAAPLRYFVLEAGVGAGSLGPHAALMARLRLPLTTATAAGVGAGASVGSFLWTEGPLVDQPAEKEAHPGYFGNLELIIEHRFGAERGFQMRELMGAAILLNPGDLHCTESITDCEQYHANAGKRLLFLGMSFGYYF
jgi:hypothetical protein